MYQSIPENTSQILDAPVQTENYVLNVTTENSFSSLLTDDDGQLSTELNRSCPEPQVHQSREDFENLMLQLNDLNQRLASAENELDTLLLENFALKRKIENYELQNRQLKLICKSTTSNPIACRNSTTKKNVKRKTLDFSEIDRVNCSIDDLRVLNAPFLLRA